MKSPKSNFLYLLLIAGLLATSACIFRDTASVPPMQLSLFSGVTGMVNLGDDQAKVLRHLTIPPKKVDLAGTDLAAIGFTEMFDCPDQGMRIYFRHGRAALLEFQEPFHGTIRGKELTLFPFTRPPSQTWEDVLIRQFGTPTARSAGGRLGSESMAFSWGDISYNGMGPNEIALYRDPDVIAYRQRNFGRVLKFFKN